MKETAGGAALIRDPRRAAWVVFVAFTLAGPLARADGQRVDAALLGRLAQHVAAIDRAFGWASLTIVTRYETLRGATVDSVREEETRYRRAGGHEARRLVRCVEDGKDCSKRERRERDADHGHSQEVELPFAAAEQAKYLFTFTGAEPASPGRVWIAFAPRGAASTELFVGKALVNVSSGVLEEIVGTVSKLPMGLRRVDVRARFDATTPFGTGVSQLDVDYETRFLFFKRHRRIVIRVSDYARPSEIQ
jgi:hypothetical protein